MSLKLNAIVLTYLQYDAYFRVGAVGTFFNHSSKVIFFTSCLVSALTSIDIGRDQSPIFRAKRMFFSAEERRSQRRGERRIRTRLRRRRLRRQTETEKEVRSESVGLGLGFEAWTRKNRTWRRFRCAGSEETSGGSSC